MYPDQFQPFLPPFWLIFQDPVGQPVVDLQATGPGRQVLRLAGVPATAPGGRSKLGVLLVVFQLLADEEFEKKTCLGGQNVWGSVK